MIAPGRFSPKYNAISRVSLYFAIDFRYGGAITMYTAGKNGDVVVPVLLFDNGYQDQRIPASIGVPAKMRSGSRQMK